jgi:capsular exopolysaccharide synthesis family protein
MVYDNTSLQIDQRTHAQMLKSIGLHTQVLQDPNSPIRNTAWIKQFLVKQRQPDGMIKEVLDDAEAKRDLYSEFDAVPIQESKLIMVSMTYQVPKDAKVIVEDIVNRHLQQQQKILSDRTDERSRSLNQLKTRYDATIRDLSSQANTKLAKLTEMNGGMPNFTASAMDYELAKMLEAMIERAGEYTQIKNEYDSAVEALQRGQSPSAVGRMIDSDLEILRHRGALADIEMNEAGLKHTHGSESSLVKRFETQADIMRQKLQDLEQNKRAQAEVGVIEQLRSMVAVAENDVKSMQAKIDAVKTSQAEAAATRAEYLTLKDELEIFRELSQSMQRQLDTIAGQNQISANQLVWAGPVPTPDTRSFPKLPITMSVAIAVGLLLSLGIAFLREMLDTTVRSPRDIARVGQMNLLGMIPHDEDDPQSDGTPLPMVIFQAPHSMMAEQFRQVRTRLQHAASLDTTRSILVTSPEPGDGKSTVAVNLAAGLALNGRRILLVDSNFRRPELHNIFSFGNDAGFSNVLASLDNFENAIHQTPVPNLDVLTSGAKPANATELMESQLLVDFIERALEEYDHVIFDSGPMLFVSETVALAPRVDGVVTVVRARSNTRGLLQRMRDGLRQLKAEHLGVVLNGVRSQGGGYYGRNIKTYYEYQNGQPAVAAAR